MQHHVPALKSCSTTTKHGLHCSEAPHSALIKDNAYHTTYLAESCCRILCCRGFVQGDITSWRVAFMLGLLAGALGAVRNTPPGQAFDVLPATFTVSQPW
jgi:hypothetical protein